MEEPQLRVSVLWFSNWPPDNTTRGVEVETLVQSTESVRCRVGYFDRRLHEFRRTKTVSETLVHGQ